MEKEKIKIEKTKKGFPCLWEAGGGYTNTGEATIIANPDGSPKTPIYIRQRGHLACNNHALFIVNVGDVVIMADHHREDFEAVIYKISAITGEEAELTQINKFSQGEWDTELPDFLKTAVQAAMEKATCYHCREPHYMKTE